MSNRLSTLTSFMFPTPACLCIKHIWTGNMVDFVAPRRYPDLYSTPQSPGQSQLLAAAQGQAIRRGKSSISLNLSFCFTQTVVGGGGGGGIKNKR